MTNDVTVQFLGCGDAFGSGGRLQTCIHVNSTAAQVLIDCGATSLPAMKRARVDPGAIDAVVVSHLHGDHFGGLPFLILDGHFASRPRPLAIVGPAGIQKRVEETMEAMFPASTSIRMRFEITYTELQDRREAVIGPLTIVPFAVIHPSGAPAYALRLGVNGVVVAYSGDTGWTDALLDAARGSHLFICESYQFDRPLEFHLDYATVRGKLDMLGSRRVILTHLGVEMLQRVADVDVQCAEDGMVVHLHADA